MAFEAWVIRDTIVSPEVSRLVAYLASGGGSGVVGRDDFMVRAQAAPNGTVQLLPGAGAAVSRFPGAAYQSYAVRNITTETVPIAPTGSSGGRTDWLVIRVWDDQYTGTVKKVGWEILSADPRVSKPAFPYFLAAKITQPANNTAITQAMIDTGPSIREMVNPRVRPMVLAWNGRADGNTNIKANPLTNVNNVTKDYWLPTSTTYTYLKWEIPEWASQINLQYTYGNVYTFSKDCWGWVTIRMVDPSNPTVNWINFANVDFDLTKDNATAQWARETWTGGARLVVPAWARGKTVEFRPLATKVGGDQAGAQIYLGSGASVSMVGTLMESTINEVL